MSSIKNYGMAVILSGISISALAVEPVDGDWKSNAEVGIVVTNGNTKTSTVSAKFDTNKEVEKWRHNLHAETLSSSSDNVKSAEKYLASGQSSYKFNKFDYMFGLLMYEKDLFSGYQYQATLVAGYGRRLPCLLSSSIPGTNQQ